MHAVIIGAGAAGCFCAIELKRRNPDMKVTVLEKGTRPLAKVAITGGGRCNLTNSFAEVRSMEKVYPRGHKLMKRLLKEFSHEDTMRWFEQHGVRLVTQTDQCVFPQSQDAMEIVNTLLREMQRAGVKLITRCKVEHIERTTNGYVIHTNQEQSIQADKVIVTTGGYKTQTNNSILTTPPLGGGWEGLLITTPVPSLFTFNISDSSLHDLMGTVVEPVSTRLTGTKFQAEGPLLITHWGMSGPAILKLSSYAARHLADNDYKAELSVNWFCDMKEPEVAEILQSMVKDNPRKQLSNIYPEQFCQRHWLYIINKVGLQPDKRWGELGPKQLNRLASLLTNDTYAITGKGQYKDEFVTCGGVALSNLNLNTLECKQYPGLYFAGEATDVDAITGGFNLQAAWTMGYVIGKNSSQPPSVASDISPEGKQ